jgi:hypothetical protein
MAVSWCEALKGPREARRAELLERTAEGEPLTRITNYGASLLNFASRLLLRNVSPSSELR